MIWIIRCSDRRYRFNPSYQNGLKGILSAENIQNDYHDLRCFGAALGFVLNPGWAANQLKIAAHLGKKRFLIVDHMDCHAYPLEFGPLSTTNERRKHIEMLTKASALVRKHQPEITPIIYIQDGHRYEKIAV